VAGEAYTIPTGVIPVDQVKPADGVELQTEKASLPQITDLIVDPALHSLIPPLTDSEYAALKENIVKDGCREPLTIWKDHNIILDGHNRYKICKEGDLRYQIVEIELADLTAAKIWIIKNQRGRRNLNESQRAMMAVKLEKLYAEPAKERKGTRTDLGQKLEPSEVGRSADKAANDMGVSHQTVSYAKKVSKKGIPELVELAKSGKIAVSAAAKVAALESQVQTKVVEKFETEIKKGNHPRVGDVISKIAPKDAKNTPENHFKKVNKSLNTCLKLLEGTDFAPDQKDLTTLREVIQKIAEKLNGIGENNPDHSNKEVALVSNDD
jgi:ParB-like chromosome segregation protein Spo0J